MTQSKMNSGVFVDPEEFRTELRVWANPTLRQSGKRQQEIHVVIRPAWCFARRSRPYKYLAIWCKFSIVIIFFPLSLFFLPIFLIPKRGPCFLFFFFFFYSFWKKNVDNLKNLPDAFASLWVWNSDISRNNYFTDRTDKPSNNKHASWTLLRLMILWCPQMPSQDYVRGCTVV